MVLCLRTQKKLAAEKRVVAVFAGRHVSTDAESDQGLLGGQVRHLNPETLLAFFATQSAAPFVPCLHMVYTAIEEECCARSSR
jgi:hypothetical protein